MILVDIPRGNKDSAQFKNQDQLKTFIRAMGVMCDPAALAWGDAAMEGHGPDGPLMIGIERKALHDFLNCIDDAHYAGKQRIGMKKMYGVSFLMIEGYWKCREDGILMESRDGSKWWPCRPHGKNVMYSKIRRYLISMSYSGVIVNFTRDLRHTAQDICEIWHYHQKPWNKHTSLREVPKLAIPQLNARPSLVRKWASDITGVGVVLSEEAERVFKKPINLAKADEEAWLQVPGISVDKAKQIVKEIHGF